MACYFCLSVQFLHPIYHGRRDGNAPEWPPSPLRLFQSLVATSARETARADSALSWLEQAPPHLIAPVGISTPGYQLSVPNNAMDIVARAWCRGNYSGKGDAGPATHRTMKRVRPTHIVGGDVVHYLWPLEDPVTREVRDYVDVLGKIARNLVVLGWGVDMAVAHGAIMSEEDLETLSGERWFPTARMSTGGLRVPVSGTLNTLKERHARFLARLDSNALTAPPPLSRYATLEYRRATDPPRRAIAPFSLLKLDGSAFRAFDTAQRALSVAGMMRHAVKLAAERAGWTSAKIHAFVLGHGDSNESGGHVAVGPQRFAYVPVPSVEGRGEGKPLVVGSVRRVLLTAFGDDCEEQISWARRSLPGQELMPESSHEPVALLSLVPESDRVVRYYMQRAASWATVTPVVLPGYDDPAHYRRRLEKGVSTEEQRHLLARLDDRIDGLLRKAIRQTGFSEVLADHAELEWRKVGYWPGTERADRYGVPDHLRRFPRLHVRITWRDAHDRPLQIDGPVCIGGGRFYGLGLFAPYGPP